MHSVVTLVANSLLVAITKTISYHEKEAQLMTDLIYQTTEHIHTLVLDILCSIAVYGQNGIA